MLDFRDVGRRVAGVCGLRALINELDRTDPGLKVLRAERPFVSDVLVMDRYNFSQTVAFAFEVHPSMCTVQNATHFFDFTIWHGATRNWVIPTLCRGVGPAGCKALVAHLKGKVQLGPGSRNKNVFEALEGVFEGLGGEGRL
ncbi:MAG TPA: hypothetical protein VHB73_08415, partial [Alphaproteobacteria bacterium]|nr:hypothetical protein [Alphaproteobacteria bacterium]